MAVRTRTFCYYCYHCKINVLDVCIGTPFKTNTCILLLLLAICTNNIYIIYIYIERERERERDRQTDKVGGERDR